MDNQAKMFPTAAVVDTGVSQERLATGALLSGVNLSGEGSPETTADDNGHGTAVAAPPRSQLAFHSPADAVRSSATERKKSTGSPT